MEKVLGAGFECNHEGACVHHIVLCAALGVQFGLSATHATHNVEVMYSYVLEYITEGWYSRRLYKPSNDHS